MISKHQILFAAVLACCCSLGADPVLPDATYQVILGLPDGSGITYNTAGSYTLGGTAGSALGGPDAASQASLLGNKDASSGADAFLTYYFTVAGSTFGQIIPIDIAGSLFVSASTGITDDIGAGASITVTTALNQDSASLQASSDTNGSASSSPLLHVDFYGGDQYLNFVQLTAAASGYGGSAQAFADPYIYVDPNYANASDYSIVVSQGIANTPVSATPEPSSLALAGVALGCVVLLRRKKAGTKLVK